ncbi:MAG: GNAT family N-acetyltransferase [Thermofilaceae archaeon]
MKFKVIEGDLKRFIEFDRVMSWPFVSEKVKKLLSYDEYARRHEELVKQLYLSNSENFIRFAVNEEGKVIGAVWAGIKVDSVDFIPICYIYDMEVSEDFRGHGIGTALLSAVEEFCRLKGIERMALTTTVENTEAIKWYRRKGFTISRVYMQKKL